MQLQLGALNLPTRWMVAQSTEPSGRRESSLMDRSIMEEAHPCRFAPRRRSQRETRSVPTLSSAVFRRQIARTAVTCPLGHGLGWVGLHDRILWEVGFAQEWKVELDTDMCICRLGGENGVTHGVLEALSSGRVLPICVQEHCPRHVYLPK
jgi:hypothetical protein